MNRDTNARGEREPQSDRAEGYSPLKPDTDVNRAHLMRSDYFEPMTPQEADAELEAQIVLAIQAKDDLLTFLRTKGEMAEIARITAMPVEDFLSQRGKAMIDRITGNIPKPLPSKFSLGGNPLALL